MLIACIRTSNAQISLDSAVKRDLLAYLPAAPAGEASMEIDGTDAPTTTKPAPVTTEPLPETEVYFRLLIVYHLLASPDTRKDVFKIAHETVDKIQAWNRRSMDALAARVWFALGRAYELAGELEEVRP